MARSVRLRLPMTRWLTLGAMVAALGMALVVDGFSHHSIGQSSTLAPPGTVSGLDAPGPILDLSGPQPRSAPLPQRTVALTFDDGPDPEWTPKILEVLRRHDVPATFFVVGTQAARHPELVRRELAAGHEVGAHTFTHSDLGAASGLRTNIDLSLSQSALAGAAGIRTNLLRLPYSSNTAEITRPSPPPSGRRDSATSWSSPPRTARTGDSPARAPSSPAAPRRPVVYLVVFESAVSALAGTRLRWHKLTRTGDVVVATARPPANDDGASEVAA